MRRTLYLLAAFLAPTLGAGSSAASAQSKVVILSTTTSTQDSGLLDVLVPMFERTSGYSVKTVSVGTGQALALAARGEADVALVHASSLEKQYVADGKMHNRRLVMYNDFVLIGPAEDPAGIKGMAKVAEALKKVAGARARFVSRGDKSGTHVLELGLWKLAGVEPKGAWYIESGQGMGQTLVIANERAAYTLTDRATFLAFQQRVKLPILVEKDRLLLNVYSVMEVNPANGPRVNAAGGKAFAWLSFQIAATSTGLALAVGIPLGTLIALTRFPARALVVSLINTGMGLPPVVVGLFVSIFLWRGGPLGFFELLYTPAAIVIAQGGIAAPIVTGLTLAAVQQIPPMFRLQMVAIGASRGQLLWLLLREARLPMLAAVMAGFGGVISEIGASMMVGGNIRGQTRVLTTATVMETTKGSFDVAIALSVILLAMTFLVNYLLTALQQRRRPS